MLLASPPTAAGGDSGGYAKVRFVAGGGVAFAGFRIRIDGEDCCGGAAATALSLLLLLLLRLGGGEEGAGSSDRSVSVRSSSAFRVDKIGCNQRHTVRRWEGRNLGAFSAK